jgi:HupE / UreJ protein
VWGLVGLYSSTWNGNAILSSIWLLLLGGLLAFNARPSLRVMTGLAALLGVYHGYINGAGMGSQERLLLPCGVLSSQCSCWLLLPPPSSSDSRLSGLESQYG